MSRFARFAVAAVVLSFSFTGLAEEPECPSVQWTIGSPAIGGDGSYIGHLATVDYDRDGALDLVGVNTHRRQLVWWKGAGDGTFPQGPQTLMPDRAFISNILVADATGDGLPDIICSHYPNTLLIFPTGAGPDSVLVKPLEFKGQLERTIALIQYDADPAMELVVHSREQSVDIYDDIATSPRLVASFRTERALGDLAVADFDGDGHSDIAVVLNLDPYPYFISRVLHVYFGKADGTFETPIAIPDQYATNLKVGDLNQDGRPDLVGSYSNSASVYLSQGDRTFSHSVVSLAKPGEPYGYGQSTVLADLSGEGELDLAAVVRGANDTRCWIVTVVGRGDGTFLTPTFSRTEGIIPTALAAGDFNGDGNLELEIGSKTIHTATSSCVTQVELLSDAPMILIGEEATLRVYISGFGGSYGGMPPGTVTLRDGTVTLDESPVGADGRVLFVVPGLAPGEHPLTAEFSGNAVLAGATSAVAIQRVAAEPTEIIITLPETIPVYPNPVPVQVQLTQLIDDGTRDWSVLLTVDHWRLTVHRSELPVPLMLKPGPHTISAEFLRTDYAPPGQSATTTFTVGKGNPLMTVSGLLTLRDGDAHALTFAVTGLGPDAPGGSVRLTEGTTTLASGALVDGSVKLRFALSPGIHDVRAVYQGDTLFREVARDVKLEVLPNLLFPLDAHAMADGIRIAYVLPPNGVESSLVLFRRLAGTIEWTAVPGWNRATGMDASVPLRGVAYEYRLLVSLKNSARMFSGTDSATLPKSRRRAVSP